LNGALKGEIKPPQYYFENKKWKTVSFLTFLKEAKFTLLLSGLISKVNSATAFLKREFSFSSS
jgi:hypothetical protein